MTPSDVKQSLTRFLTDTFLFDFDENVNSSTNLFDAGFIDSYGFVQLVAFIEEIFSITIEEEDLASDDIASLDGLVRLIDRLTSASRLGAEKPLKRANP